MGEAVNADLDSAIALDRIHLETAGHEFAMDFAADIVLDGVDE